MAPRIIFVTEKPSVARDIARATGCFRTGKEYHPGTWDGREAAITWAVGHLCELLPPDGYDPRYKRWSLADLPIIPLPFRLQALPRQADRFSAVARLITHASVECIVNACDAGREGELIFRQIYELAGATAPVQRLWISSLTDEAIRAGLAALRPGAVYDDLAAAARLRSQADWLVGINATRAVTKRAGDLFSVGRVQTPALALLVRREQEIAAFARQRFFQVRAAFTVAHGAYAGLWVGPHTAESPPPRDPPSAGEPEEEPAGRLPDRTAAEALVSRVAGQAGVVAEARATARSQLPPLLYDLTTLQREMNQRHGLSASRTLALAQELYEKDKTITYPRTDSRHLTPDLVPTLRGVLAAVAGHPAGQGARPVLARAELPVTGRLINAGKVTDHHAIMPTRQVPGVLPREKGLVYEAVVRRFVAAFYPPARLQTTRVWTAVAGELFYSRSTEVLDPGWMAVAGPRDPAAGDEPLPPVSTGEAACCRSADAVESETRPPARYTEAALLRAMETAGRQLDKESPDTASLAAILREQGLGTPATRAATIERLIQVGYVRRERKALAPTPKGVGLVEALAATELVSPVLTARWEERLRAVERGDEPEAAVFQDIAGYTRALVGLLRRLPAPAAAAGAAAAGPAQGGQAAAKQDGPVLGQCPRCRGAVRAAGPRYVCAGTAAAACPFSLPRQLLGRSLGVSHVRALLAGKRTPLIRQFTGKSGRPFDAALSLGPGGELRFHFPGRREAGPKNG